MRKLLPLSMWKLLLTVLTAVIFVTIAFVAMGESGVGQTRDAASGQPSVPYVLPGVTPPAAPLYKLEDAFLQWPLPPGAEAYGWIDGKWMHRYVNLIGPAIVMTRPPPCLPGARGRSATLSSWRQ